MKKPKPFIPVGQLAKAFSPDSFALHLSDDLAGKRINLHFEDGTIGECSFETMSKLVWKPASGARSSQATEETCTVTRVRKAIYFVDFLKHLERATTLSLVLDLSRGIFTAVEGRLPEKKEARQDILRRVDAGRELTDVVATFRHGAINRSFGPATPHHTATEELVGKRIEYTYSPTERYEHIYLNGSFYTWHCLLGAEQGAHNFRFGGGFDHSDVRRAGGIHAFDTMNHFFLISEMIVPGSSYWNIGVGREIGDVDKDEEGIRTMKTLGLNMAWLMKHLKS